MKHNFFKSLTWLVALFVGTSIGWAADPVTAPTTAAPVPTIAANRVKSIYSDSYTFAPASLNSYNEGWWNAPTMAEEAIGGNHMLHYSGLMTGMIGWQYGTLNCSQMEKLHVDIWVPTTGTINFGPTSENPTVVATKTLNVTGGQWNSFDFDLATDFSALALAKMFQHQFMNYSAQTDMYVDNYFFYRTTDPGADTEKPTAFTASLASASYTSVNITAKATDNSGAVIFKVYNGTTELASMAGASNVSTTVAVTGLTAGTAYNLTVKVQDEAGNVNDSPVAVNATTKYLPAPAAAPTRAAADVISVYSDAYTSAVPNWYVGAWSQSTVMEKMNLATGDEAVVCSNANYLGWEFGATLDCSAMNYVHFDIYVAAAGSIKFSPIWGAELLVTSNLVAGWNAIDIPLSSFTNINKANIYQLKWDGMPSECWIDNVYFYYEIPTKDIADYNYALASNGATASASSTAGDGFLAAFGNDGNEGTRWASAENDAEWWMVDMQAYCKFNTIQIVWEGAYTASFTIEASSNGTDWSTIATVTDQKLEGFPYTQTISVADTTARYVKFNATKRATQWSNSFWEFRVFKASASVLTSMALSAEKNFTIAGTGNALTIVAKDQYGTAMDPGTVTYTVTPNDMGSVVSGVFTPAKKGVATIKAKVGTVESNEITVFGITDGVDLVYSSNISTDNKVIDQSGDTEGAHNAFFAVDGNDGSVWETPHPGNVDYEAWFVADMGGKYNLEVAQMRFEGASPANFQLDASVDNVTWTTIANGTTPGMVTPTITVHNMFAATGVRYVRFKSTKAATGYGIKVFSMNVYGTAVQDTEKPEMTSATLNSKTHNSAIINVAATDNEGVASFPVYNGADLMGEYTANSGQITITGLTPETAYTLDVKAKDASGNVSDNSMQVTFTTNATPVVENPYCGKEIGHLADPAAAADSYVILSIGADGNGNTIVNIKQAAAKNNVKFDYLQVTGLASEGTDVTTGGVTEMAVKFATPQADGDGNITLEILWSTVNWGGRWMVQNVKVPATATCATAVMPLPFKDEYDTNYALTSNGGTATATSGDAALAIDGNTGTRWESAVADPQVFVVDMHAYCTFNTVQILWEGAYGKSFTIDASNDSTTWTNLATITDQELSGFPYLQTIDVTETSARYVRFTGTERGTGYGYSFWEFSVFKAGTQVLTTFEVKPAMDYSKVGADNALTITAKDQNGNTMNPGEITYVVSPATAGTVTNGKYVAAEKGQATITATAGSIDSEFKVFGVVSDNLALSTNRLTDNRIIEQSSTAAQAGSAWDAYFAVDQDVASVYQADTTNGDGGTSFDAWFVIDLKDTFDIDLIAIKFEGACAKEYSLSFSKDNVNYSTAYTYSGASGIDAHTDVLSSFTASAARYIKFNVTEAATQWGVKIFDMKVFGDEYVPTFELIRGGLTPGGLGTICLPYSLAPADRMGATFYTLNYTDGSMLYFTEETGTLEAGHAYIFEAEATEITGIIGDTAANAPVAVNGLYGTYVNMPAGSLTGKYVVAPGNVVSLCGSNAYLNANRAYIDLSEVPETPTPAPGRRQLTLGGVSRGTATGNVNVNENVNANVNANANANGKMIVNGQLIIVRDGKLYNAQGARL